MPCEHAHQILRGGVGAYFSMTIITMTNDNDNSKTTITMPSHHHPNTKHPNNNWYTQSMHVVMEGGGVRMAGLGDGQPHAVSSMTTSLTL